MLVTIDSGNGRFFKQIALGTTSKGAYLINVARGGHLVDGDLLILLDNGHLSGACLDVYHKEPLPTAHPLGP
ncbi:NAD(P)-dependent oxidoreductase [Winogradskyella maritima]|nr:NAD(P)-dependent oxidoreductase [Winogradskyella maritima]